MQTMSLSVPELTFPLTTFGEHGDQDKRRVWGRGGESSDELRRVPLLPMHSGSGHQKKTQPSSSTDSHETDPEESSEEETMSC